MSARLPGLDLSAIELIEDLAPKLGVARSTLAEWCRRERFPHIRLPHARRVLIPVAWAEAFLGGDVELEVVHGPDGGRVVRPHSCAPLKSR